jgi:hypothetical protein
VESDQIDVFAAAVFGDREEIGDILEAGTSRRSGVMSAIPISRIESTSISPSSMR